MASKTKPTTTTTTTKSKKEEAEQQPAEPKEAKGQKMKEKKGEAKAEGASADRIKSAIESVIKKAESGKLATPKPKKEAKGKIVRVVAATRSGTILLDQQFACGCNFVLLTPAVVCTNDRGQLSFKDSGRHTILRTGDGNGDNVNLLNDVSSNDTGIFFEILWFVIFGLAVMFAVASAILECFMVLPPTRKTWPHISEPPLMRPLSYGPTRHRHPPPTPTNRKILLLAPGETMEQVSPTWFQLCVGEDGSYWQNNINFPAALHPRNEATEGSYSNDPPLTNVGKAEGQLTGRAIKRNYIKVVQIFSAPDYASVETSHEVLLQLIDGEERNSGEAMLKIKVEPALAKEPIDATKSALIWLPAERFAEHGMPTVNSNYETLDASELNAEDDVWGDQRIQQFVTNNVIEADTEGTVLIVAPPSTLMAILRRLRGGWPTHRGDETRRWPSSGIVGLKHWNNNVWSTIPNVIPPLTLRRLTFDNSVQLDATDSDVFA